MATQRLQRSCLQWNFGNRFAGWCHRYHSDSIGFTPTEGDASWKYRQLRVNTLPRVTTSVSIMMTNIVVHFTGKKRIGQVGTDINFRYLQIIRFASHNRPKEMDNYHQFLYPQPAFRLKYGSVSSPRFFQTREITNISQVAVFHYPRCCLTSIFQCSV